MCPLPSAPPIQELHGVPLSVRHRCHRHRLVAAASAAGAPPSGDGQEDTVRRMEGVRIPGRLGETLARSMQDILCANDCVPPGCASVSLVGRCHLCGCARFSSQELYQSQIGSCRWLVERCEPSRIEGPGFHPPVVC